MSVLNKVVSYFPGITATTQGVEVNLLQLLQSDKHKEAILRLRQSDEANQKQLKEKLPCYTVAGTFNRRCDDGLIQPSGLAAIDLDSAEIYDAISLTQEFKKLPYVAYAGLSCRGQRLFCIVPFKYPDKYVKHYERLLKSFTDMGLPMGDDCHKRISQPRFVSWNDEGTRFFNHDAKPYHLLPAEKTYFTVKRNYQRTGAGVVPDHPFQWCIEQINKSHSFTEEGARHKYIIALARYCNIKGLPEDETLSGCLSFAQPDLDLPFPDTEIIKIVRHIYATQSDSHAKRPFIHKAAAFIKPQQATKPHPQAFEQPQPKEMAQAGELQPVEGFNTVNRANEAFSYINRQPAEETNNSEIAVKEPEILKPDEGFKYTIKRDGKDFNTVNGQLTDAINYVKLCQSESWDQDITELETFFSTANLPAVSVNLNVWTTITNVYLFVYSHLAIVKANNGNRTFLPYLHRLQELKAILTLNTN